MAFSFILFTLSCERLCYLQYTIYIHILIYIYTLYIWSFSFQGRVPNTMFRLSFHNVFFLNIYNELNIYYIKFINFSYVLFQVYTYLDGKVPTCLIFGYNMKLSRKDFQYVELKSILF